VSDGRQDPETTTEDQEAEAAEEPERLTRRRHIDDAVTRRGSTPSLPVAIADIYVPQDAISAATWEWAHRSLPEYLFAHSVRSYAWGAALGDMAGWTYDRQVLWTSSLLHDVGLSRLATNTMCFEVEGAEIARRVLLRLGLSPDLTETVAIAIILHMQPSVTLDDGVEALLLDRSTSLDVRGERYDAVDRIRADVMRAFPRRAFDRYFLAAMRREAEDRPTCQSARLIHGSRLAEAQRRSPWATRAD
jgi:cyanamide hydratase family protein with HD domain